MPGLDRFSTARPDGGPMKTTGIALVAAVLVIAACGGGDAPTAASCADSWNADANVKQQATLAGVLQGNVLVGDKFRVGTWPKGEQKVSVTEGFADVKDGRPAVVGKDSCVIVLPDSRLGRMAFVEADGKWGYVWGTKATFPEAASKSVAGARLAEPDVLGKLKLQGR
jgi:hypothetical protein